MAAHFPRCMFLIHVLMIINFFQCFEVQKVKDSGLQGSKNNYSYTWNLMYIYTSNFQNKKLRRQLQWNTTKNETCIWFWEIVHYILQCQTSVSPPVVFVLSLIILFVRTDTIKFTIKDFKYCLAKYKMPEQISVLG